ncbi:hypothetical protein FSP39_017284 [Pinctada imbricata]|uniref:VWFA domain-containing protein n=1 Tax=Pinctada imbricata TaxID=66713 RepID=A0AA88Y5S9_PINIB|nr:hypothetical protein FSP39_017284 [Pinctada imbricata]
MLVTQLCEKGLFCHQIAREIWEGHCGTIPSSEHTDLTRMLVNSLNCADVCSNPGLAHIVLCGEPLRHILQQYKDILASNSRFPPALVSLVNHIHCSLGINTQHSKTFLTFWKSNGHPYVYETKEEAEREITLLNLCQSYDMHHEVAEMLMQAKAKFWLAEGNHVTQILTKCAHMVKGKNDGVIDEFAHLICTVQTVLQKYGLIQNTETRIYSQTDRQDGEPVGALTQSLWSHATSQPCQMVALWPLFEHSKLMAVQDCVSVWMGSDDRLHDGTLDSLYSYSLLFTPSQAAEPIQYYKSALAKLREEKIEALQSLLNDMYAQSWRSTVGNHVNRWLSWKPDIDTPEFIVNDVDFGPGFPHKATLSRLYFNYLCGHQDSQSHLYELQPLQVPLGEYKRQSQKLSYIRSHLWAHSALYGSQSANPRMKERAHLIECFLHFLLSLKPIVPSTDYDVYSEKLSLLHHHLHTNSVDEACTALGRIKEKLCHIEWVELQTVIQQCFVTLVKVLTKCQSNRGDHNVYDEEKTEIGEGSVESRRTSLTVIGEAWVYLGMAKTILLTPCVPVDPVERTTIKITHCKQELSDIDCELSVRNDYHRMMTGENLTCMSHDLLHPHVTYLMQRKLRLHQKLADLQCQQAYRPDILQFHRLAADIRSYMTSIGSPQSVQELLCKLSKTSESGGGSNTVSQERMWQKSQAAFIRGLERNYPHYKDLTVPFCVAVQQMRRGMRLVAMVTEEKEEEQRRIALHTNHTDENLHSLILMLARFPTITMETSCSLDLVNTLTSPSIHSMLKAVCKADGSDDTLDSALLARLNYSTLQQTYNSVLLRKELTPEGLSSLNKVIHQFMLAWQHQEELKQRKEAENSLYKYKTKIHGDERDYDEIEEAEFLQNFPSYQKDFQDVIVSQSLDDNTMEDSEVVDMSSLEEESSSVLNEQDITFLCHVHHTVFTQMTSADWLRQELSSKVKVNDVISPVLTNYRIAAVLFNKSLSNDVDQYLCGSHLLAVNELQSGISHHKESKDNSSRIYDIYHDPNIQEVLRCPPVLERLVTRVTELQMEWPDHPVLKQIIEIVKRILSFPLTAPVIKYLTGMELLVEKAQEWESNAAKHVSLMKELGDISLVIMEWRKLELSCWSQCLDVVQSKQSQNACKWWFFLLQLIQSESTEQDDIEVMKTLKEFMEQSTLGEYEARLGMLRAFHCHMINMELDSSKEYMKKFLWNLYHFYHQFLQIVQDKIKQLRAPIEKELKGFVKIARWTDMNYWALKQSTEKTHRTLHKHIKSYKSLLLEPVKGILSEVDPGLDSGSSDPGAWKESFTMTLMSSVNPTLTNMGSIPKSADPIFLALDMPLHKKLPSLIHKAVKHWTSLTTEGHMYSKLTVTLDEFTGEVIQTTVDLQSLQVTQGADREKQRSEAKHIGLKKRKALADLFKYLTQIGLSHRKGLILSSNQSADSSLLVQPVDLRAMCVSQGISEIWQSCHQYYYKCIARKARFNSVLQTPSKELGVGNIERCKGFIDHLNTLMLDQYSTIAKLSQNWKTFRSLLGDVETLQTSYHHPDQDKLQDWTVQVKNMLISVIEGVHQFEALLQCCPQPVNEEPHPSPYPRGSLCQMAVVRQGDELWTSCIQLVQEISTESEKLYDEVLIVSKHSLYTWEDLSMLSEVLQKTEMFIPKLSHLESVFMTPGEATPSSFTDTLTVLRTSILGVSERFREWNKECMRRRDTLDNSLTRGTCQDCSPSPVVHEFAGHVEELIASLLLVIQSLKKSNETGREETGIENGDTHEEEDSLMDGLFVKKLDGTLQEDFENLQCTKIMSKLGDLTNRLRGMWTEDYPSPRDTGPSSRLLLQCLPLLQQYRHFLEYYLLQLLASHRACSKLLSVLLGIFTELAAKGFCTPAEFEDEVSGEGATEFEDIEGGGMGEGEGAKDVSDQIENEDQLDEAQKPGEKKEEDTSNQPDIRSEDNAIEMSEDFEGKMQDLEEADLEERSDDGREEEEEIDKQMGEVDDNDADKLDEQMWGGDNEEDEQEDKPEKEEFGPGAEQEQTSELVANEDNKDQIEGKDGEKKQEQEEKEEENGRTNDKEIFDESEYDDDKVDPTSHQQPDQQTDAMELPDDLDLDEEEAEKDEEAQGQGNSLLSFSSDEKEDMDQKGEENDVNGTEDNSNKDEQNNEDELSPEKEEGVNDNSKEGEEAADEAQAAQHSGKTTHDAQNVEQSDQSQDQAGEGDNDQEEPLKRKPGKLDSNRSLGDPEQKYRKLKTTEESSSDQQDNSEDVAMETDTYEHIKDPSSEHDAQTVDTATADQLADQSLPQDDTEEAEHSQDVDMEQEDRETEEEIKESLPAGLRKKEPLKQGDGNHDNKDMTDNVDTDKHEVEGDVIATMSVARKPESTIHTTLENLYLDSKSEVNIEKLRAELEEQLTTFTHKDNISQEAEHSAAEAWHKYEALTSALSQELCEQLRLVLEPSQATKLRGDYRTGKRLNMRKVIPYIASQFRKDKIWLRRTKPSKRQYQVLLAIDDSSSMVDNHSKQIAYETLALLANGLALLEVGELAICSFGETVKLLHPFSEQFTSQSGARILQHFTFEQKKTKIAQLLKQTTAMMMEARSRQHGSMGNPDTSQLLLIVSDGRGLFIEGMETVKSAVRKAREANIFLVFVIIDSPHNKDSVLDIKVPVFKSATQIPEIKSYMDHFPFPFYIILRDINNLPEVMSDALRQWFELVTAGDR